MLANNDTSERYNKLCQTCPRFVIALLLNDYNDDLWQVPVQRKTDTARKVHDVNYTFFSKSIPFVSEYPLRTVYLVKTACAESKFYLPESSDPSKEAIGEGY